jgi:hypothetical protein
VSPTEAAARLAAARAYRAGRQAGYLDLAGRRAERALDRLEAELVAGIYRDGHAAGILSAGLALRDAVPCLAELETALALEVRPRLRRAQRDGRERAAGVRNAIRRACRELDVPLDDVLPGLDGELERIRDRSRIGRQVVA